MCSKRSMSCRTLEMHLDAAAFETKENSQKLVRDVEDLHTCVKRNQVFVPNYGERYRNLKKIASGPSRRRSIKWSANG
jgi:hypothetical protein